MAQKYLLAIDDTDAAVRTAKYLKKVLKKGDKVTIFNVIHNMSVLYNINDPAGMPIYTENQAIFTQLEDDRKEKMNKEMEKIKKIITDSGISKNDVNVKIENQKIGNIAGQIAEEAKKGKFNTVVMGKHNSSRISEFILGSVTHKLIHLSEDIPVIVV